MTINITRTFRPGPDIAPEKVGNMNNKYVEALNNGAEVVIVSANPADNSAIYWKRGGNYFTFCTATGEMERSRDYNDERFVKHLQKMQNDAALIFIRGTGK